MYNTISHSLPLWKWMQQNICKLNSNEKITQIPWRIVSSRFPSTYLSKHTDAGHFPFNQNLWLEFLETFLVKCKGFLPFAQTDMWWYNDGTDHKVEQKFCANGNGNFNSNHLKRKKWSPPKVVCLCGIISVWSVCSIPITTSWTKTLSWMESTPVLQKIQSKTWRPWFNSWIIL